MTNIKSTEVINYFNTYAKGSIKSKNAYKGCIIYTRVSTKNQAENGMSLDTQKRFCEEYAQKNQIPILNYFGGTYESAKSDERKEFNRMLDFIRANRKSVNVILVYSFDRFSRTGPNAIFLMEKLKKQEISVISISQPSDTNTATGKFTTNFQIMYAEYDNQVRREKCVTGMKEALKRGEWPHKPPFGYDVIGSGSKRQIVVNNTGKILRKIFQWIATKNISQAEAQRKLEELGVKILPQKISKILRNPFYCGILSHNLLEGKISYGLHEKLISERTFIKVNQILEGNSNGYHIQKENDNIPLKNFLVCDDCGTPMTGYQVKSKKRWYYKCRTKGCCNNISAKYLHTWFNQSLQPLQLNITNELTDIMVNKILSHMEDHIRINKEEHSLLEGQLNNITSKIEKLEEKYIDDQIDKQTYLKHKVKFEEQLNKIEQRLANTKIESSNLECRVSNTVYFTSNMQYSWEIADYKQKVRIQNFIYPEGIRFSKQKMAVRTLKINKLLLYLSRFNNDLQSSNLTNKLSSEEMSHLVDLRGVEPLSR